jgi:hypothetical protein
LDLGELGAGRLSLTLALFAQGDDAIVGLVPLGYFCGWEWLLAGFADESWLGHVAIFNPSSASDGRARIRQAAVSGRLET